MFSIPYPVSITTGKRPRALYSLVLYILVALGAGHAGIAQAALGAAGNQIWGQFTPGIKGQPEHNDLFGSTLVTGDFDGDNHDDLAIGSPHESVGTIGLAGAVNVIYGSVSGLQAVGDQIWHRDSPGVNGTVKNLGFFGEALAAGDFNDDGYDDLAIGVPGDGPPESGNPGNRGAVNVLYGGPGGLSASGDQLWSQDSPGVKGVAESGDSFGRVLAVGDFDADGYDDLAIGVENESIGANNEIQNAGAVNILYGGAAGLTANGDQIWTQNTPGVKGVSEDRDNFGSTLAAGDFDGDGYSDLAIGVQFESIEANNATEAGVVNVLYGSSVGLSASGDQLWHQGSPGIKGVPEEEDWFGSDLAAGDLDGDGFDDLVVGVPLESVSGLYGAGAVNVLYGTSGGLSASGDQLWHQGSPGIPGAVEVGDHFGGAVAIGDFDEDGYDDLAIGVSSESVGGHSVAGAVNVIYGGPSGLHSSGSQIWSQNTSGIQGVAEFGDNFGRALAAGDFNGNGAQDLAVGVPQEDYEANDLSNTGAVNVIYGFIRSLPF